MLANNMKKGMKIVTALGFHGEIADNKKGNIRMINVQGEFGPELGSIYTKDIRKVLNPETGQWEAVELSDAQKKQAAAITAFGF